MKVGICIPNYNMGKTLRRAIKSAIKQSHKCTIYIVDNCSTDNSWEIIKSFSNKYSNIFALKNKYHLHMAENWNKVLKIAREEDFVNILSADDILEPEFVKSCLSIFSLNKELGYVYSDRWNLINNKILFSPNFYKNTCIIPKESELLINIKGFHTVPVQLLINNEALKEVNYLNTEFLSAADMHLTLKLCSRYDVGYISKKLVVYDKSTGMGTNPSVVRLQASLFKRLKEDILENYINKDLCINKKQLQRYIDEFCARFSINNALSILEWKENVSPSSLEIIEEVRKFLFLAISFDIKIYQSDLYEYVMSNRKIDKDQFLNKYRKLYPSSLSSPYDIPEGAIIVE